MSNPKLALSTHFLGNRTLELDLFRLLRDHRVNAIELWGMDPQVDVEDSRNISKIGGWLDKAGIECASLHAPFWVDLHKPSFKWLSLAHPNPDVRDLSVARTLHAIDAAGVLGAGVVVVHGIGEFSKDSLEAAEGRFWDSMRRLAPRAEDAGVRLAVENIITPHSLTRIIRRFVERFGNQQVGICVDVGHAFIDDDPQRALDDAMPYLFEVHIADNMGTEDDHLIPNEGRLEWEPIWPRLKGSDELAVMTFEIMPPCIAGEYTMAEFKKRLEKVAAAMEEAQARIDG